MKRSHTTTYKKKKSRCSPTITAKRKSTALGLIPENLTTLHMRSDLPTSLLYNTDTEQGSCWPGIGPKIVLFLFCKSRVYVCPAKAAGAQQLSLAATVLPGIYSHWDYVTFGDDKPRFSHCQ